MARCVWDVISCASKSRCFPQKLFARRYSCTRYVRNNNVALQSGRQSATPHACHSKLISRSFNFNLRHRFFCEAPTTGAKEPVDINGDGSVIKTIVQDSTGEADDSPSKGSMCDVDYVGTLEDGTVFDSNELFTFTVGSRVIEGWSDGVVTMKPGEIAEFVIAPNKAYGTGGSGKIPPNATLKFKITLLHVHEAEAKEGDPWIQAYNEKKQQMYYHHPYSKEAFWVAPTSEIVCVEKASLLKRMGAALIDTAASIAFGTSIALAMTYELEHVFYGQIGGAFTFMSTLVAKDCVLEFGSRSIGKRLLGLEILRLDATIACRPRTLLRNIYFPLQQTVQLLGPVVVLFFGADFLTMALSKDRRRLGDRMADTIVVTELPNREERVLALRSQNARRDNDGELGEFYKFKRSECGDTVRWLTHEEAVPHYSIVDKAPEESEMQWEPLVIEHPPEEIDTWGYVEAEKEDKTPKGKSFIDLAK